MDTLTWKAKNFTGSLPPLDKELQANIDWREED